MDKLLELVRKYCQQRNLIEDAYIQGMSCQKYRRCQGVGQGQRDDHDHPREPGLHHTGHQ